MKSALFLAAAASLFATAAMAGETIPVGPFRAIQIHGGGSVLLHKGSTQHVTLTDGSTRYTSFYVDGDGTLQIDTCRHTCPQGTYKMQVDIDTPGISGVAIEGGGAVIGDADLPVTKFSAAVEGGGNIDMRAVHARDVHAAVEGGGHIQVYAGSHLTAAVNGGGVIEYWGKPELTTAVAGGGFVRAGL
ncbi:MAG: DUF2807 domain-containing protein [Proteobacteria bacterium]|nr:DUF2807 domain-containing protein [Pseudomonadota bacterium]